MFRLRNRCTSFGPASRLTTVGPIGGVGDEIGAPGAHVLEVDFADSSEEAFAGAEDGGRNVESQFVDESYGEVLVDGRRAAGDGYVEIARSGVRLASADSAPSVTKVKVVPPSITSISRRWCVSTNTGA
jgi:hypothetical protein